MISRSLGVGLVLAAGMALASHAGAQTNTYDLDLVGTASEVGMYHVKLQKWDGAVNTPGKTFRITQVIKETGPQPVGQGVEVDISFYGQLGAMGPTVKLASITGDAGVTTITSHIPPDPQTHNWAIAMYNGPGTKFGSFTSPTGITPDVIRKSATNQFLENSSGRITTQSLVASAQVSVITDNGHIYSGIVDMSTTAVPEASSLMLLLPGLVPVGVMIRRRARKSA